MPEERQQRTANDLTQGSVAGQLRRQATPFALGLVAIFSFDAADLFFISRLGEDPLAAVSFCLPVIWLVYGIGIGFEAGAASCVSRAVGRKDERLAKRLTTDTTLLGALVACVLVALGLSTIGPVFRLLGATDEVIPLVRDYMGIWYWVAPVDMTLWIMLASIRARGNTLLESKLVTVAAMLNLAMDPVFIFGLFGFPRMEIAGAAVATVTSSTLTLAFAVAYLHLRLGVFAKVLAPLREILDSWRHLLQIAIPAMITNAIVPISSGIVVSLIAAYGVDSVAGYGIAMRMEPLALIPFYALSAISSPFFGQNFGAERFDRALEARRAVMRFCLVFGLGLATLVSLAATTVVGFYTQAPAIADVTHHYLWTVSWSWGAYGIVMAVNASFNGSGRPLPSVLISSSRVIFVLLPLVLVGRWLFGLPGLFGAICVSNLVVAAMAYAWLGRHIRRAAHGHVRMKPAAEGVAGD